MTADRQSAAVPAAMTDVNELEAAARELGRKAFEDGRKAVPAWDPALCAMLSPRPSGTVGADAAVRILDAWSRAWHSANAAAPVPLEGRR